MSNQNITTLEPNNTNVTVNSGQNLGLIEKVKKRKPRSYWKIISALFLVILPTLFAIIYYGFIASNQYVTEFRFAVRNQEVQKSDALGAATGLPGNMLTLASDSYIVVNYLQSRQALDELDKVINIKDLYSNEKIDYISRFNKKREIEYLVDYWKGQLSTNFDISTGLIIVKVRAFTPESSLKIGELLLKQTEDLVNIISQNSRGESMKTSEEEVKRAEFRLKSLRAALKNIRESEQIADPLRNAALKQEFISKIQADLSQLRAEIANSKAFLREDSPTVTVLRSREKSLIEQLKKLNDELAGLNQNGKEKSVTSMLANFEEIEVERQFAEKNYASALASLERSRLEAERKQRYLAVFVKPSLPEYALYPRRIEMIAMIMILTLMLWALFTFVIQAIKDHLN